MIFNYFGQWYRVSPDITGGLHITIKGLPDVQLLLPTCINKNNIEQYSPIIRSHALQLKTIKVMTLGFTTGGN